MGGGRGDRIAGEKGPTNHRGVRRGEKRREREEEGLEAAWDKKKKKVGRGDKNNIQVST